MIINNILNYSLGFEGKKYLKNRKKPPIQSTLIATKPKVEKSNKQEKKPFALVQNETDLFTQEKPETPYYQPVILKTFSIDKNLRGVARLKNRINYLASYITQDAPIISKEAAALNDTSIHNYAHAKNVINHIMFDDGYSWRQNFNPDNSETTLYLGSKIYKYSPLEFSDKNGDIISFEIKEYKKSLDMPKRIIKADLADNGIDFKPAYVQEFDGDGNSMTFFYNKPIYKTLAIKNYREEDDNWSGDSLIVSYGKVVEAIEKPEGVIGDMMASRVEKYTNKYFLHSDKLVEYSTNYDNALKASKNNELKLRFFDDKLKFAEITALGMKNKRFVANEEGMLE